MLPALIYICGQPLDAAIESTPKEIKRNYQEEEQKKEEKAAQKEMRVVFNGTKVELPLSNNGKTNSADIKLVPPTNNQHQQTNVVTTGATFV